MQTQRQSLFQGIYTLKREDIQKDTGGVGNITIPILQVG